jgi:hypothetical protein
LTFTADGVTFDYLDTVTGQVRRGRIDPASRAALREWLQRFAGRSDVTYDASKQAKSFQTPD